MENTTKNSNSNISEKIASFDKKYSTNHIRMLKIILHYIQAPFRRNLIVYIKYLELQHTLSLLHNTIQERPGSDAADVSSLINELLPLCTSSERQKFENLSNMMNTFDQMKNMMEMMEMMKDMFPDGEGGFDPSMLAGMMGMDGFTNPFG